MYFEHNGEEYAIKFRYYSEIVSEGEHYKFGETRTPDAEENTELKCVECYVATKTPELNDHLKNIYSEVLSAKSVCSTRDKYVKQIGRHIALTRLVAKCNDKIMIGKIKKTYYASCKNIPEKWITFKKDKLDKGKRRFDPRPGSICT